MLKSIARCSSILAEVESTSPGLEYTDTMVEFVETLKAAVEQCVQEHQMSPDVLLLFHQITTSLPFVATHSQVLVGYFKDRITLSLEELKDAVSENVHSEDPPSVMSSLDSVLDTLDDILEKDSLNIATLSAMVSNLLAQVLSFHPVVLPEDGGKILTMCKLVLSKKLAMEETKDRLMVEDLRRSILALEELLSSCILRVFVHVMVELDEKSSEKCSEALLPKGSLSTTDFDLLMDRLIQLGIIACSFADSNKMKLCIRSAVASLESLDLHFVPCMLMCHGKNSSDRPCDLMFQLWKEESMKLAVNIHKIIDTKLFAASVVESATETLNNLESDRTATNVKPLARVLQIARVFHHHLSLNSVGDDVERLGQLRKDLNIMLKECKAALKYVDCEKEISKRIFKRFRLLVHVVGKIRNEIPNYEPDVEENESIAREVGHFSSRPQDLHSDGVFDDIVGATEYFKSFGIGMTTTTRLFYPKPRGLRSNTREYSGMRNQTMSMIPQLPSHLLSASKLGITRRNGQIFRQPINISGFGQHTKGLLPEVNINESTMNLNVTEILEQLGKCSETFRE